MKGSGESQERYITYSHTAPSHREHLHIIEAPRPASLAGSVGHLAGQPGRSQARRHFTPLAPPSPFSPTNQQLGLSRAASCPLPLYSTPYHHRLARRLASLSSSSALLKHKSCSSLLLSHPLIGLKHGTSQLGTHHPLANYCTKLRRVGTTSAFVLYSMRSSSAIGNVYIYTTHFALLHT